MEEMREHKTFPEPDECTLNNNNQMGHINILLLVTT